MAKPAKDSKKPARKDSDSDARAEAVKTGLRRGVLIAFLFVLIIAAAIGYRYFQRSSSESRSLPDQAIAIGGPFSLVDHQDRPVTQNTFKGRFMLVFFGYTFCPDICPTTLTEIGTVLDGLGPEAKKVTPVFITVDPERDTPEYLKEYLAHFHPRIVGLTGTPDQVKAVAGAYKVYFAKVASQDQDYLMEHMTSIFLMGPDGVYRTRFSGQPDAKTMTAKIREFL